VGVVLHAVHIAFSIMSNAGQPTRSCLMTFFLFIFLESMNFANAEAFWALLKEDKTYLGCIDKTGHIIFF